uniref:Uncharacterized protein n=1 Tax=Physcomitrium patens TaxID=3218 RepID=A0A2K1KM02_PHYPA|nr:hypothetical protein PHYPA_005694 [Physcomitrium patens]
MSIFVVKFKIYEQRLFGEKRPFFEVANFSMHLSIVKYFVESLLAAIVCWSELAKCLWFVDLVHYLVLFITLY